MTGFDVATLEARIKRNERRITRTHRLMWILPAAWVVVLVADTYTPPWWEWLTLLRYLLSALVLINIFYEHELRIGSLEAMAGLTALAMQEHLQFREHVLEFVRAVQLERSRN